jgi:hypothetical protein
VRVNVLYYEWTNLKGEKKVFTWLINIKLNARDVEKSDVDGEKLMEN